jgi:hypothetical protein
MTTDWGTLSGFSESANEPEIKAFAPSEVEQSYPRQYPESSDPLGAPLSIRQVAELLGCSPWTVRQKYLPQGLPHLRSGRQGRLIFYRNQIVRWILLRQQKGGRR